MKLRQKLTEIVNNVTDTFKIEDSKEFDLNLSERIGLGLLGACAPPVMSYITRILNHDLFANALKLPEVVQSLSYNGGDFHHIFSYYWLTQMIEGKKSNKYSNIILGLTTTYFTLGEIFHSSVAPDLPKILPGTPDIKDVPVVLLGGLGMYLFNKRRILF